jgi:hypothetical protein
MLFPLVQYMTKIKKNTDTVHYIILIGLAISTNNIARGMVRVYRIRFQPTKIRFQPHRCVFHSPYPKRFLFISTSSQPLDPIALFSVVDPSPPTHNGPAPRRLDHGGAPLTRASALPGCVPNRRLTGNLVLSAAAILLSPCAGHRSMPS